MVDKEFWGRVKVIRQNHMYDLLSIQTGMYTQHTLDRSM